MSANLFGSTRSKLLTLFFTHPEKEFYINQIIRMLGLGNGITQRELKNLDSMGIITPRHLGNLCLYQANKRSPTFNELKGLIIKSFGVADEIANGLDQYRKHIQIAFIFGSFVNGEFSARSDIDLLIVADLSFQKISGALAQAQKTRAREINPVVFSRLEFARRMKSGDGFLSSVLNGDKIFIVGGENELGAMVGERLAKKTGVQEKPNNGVAN